MSTNRRAGFSLIELLIVMAIIALLMALLFPAIWGARHAARRSQCANNLHNIGVAYTNCMSTNRKFRGLDGWAAELKPFCSNTEKVFVCPNDPNPAVSLWVPPAYLHVRNRGYPEYNGSQDIPLAGNGPRCRYSLNVPPSPIAGAYALEVEDATDWDWNDMRMLLEPLPNGSVQMTCVYKNAGYTFDLLDWNKQVRVSDWSPFKSTIYPAEMSLSSYAVNNYASYIDPGVDSTKILALEYKKVVADVVGPNAQDLIFTQWVAPRHRDHLTVLFSDGHVETRLPGEINPGIGQVKKDLWQPIRSTP